MHRFSVEKWASSCFRLTVWALRFRDMPSPFVIIMQIIV